jgi:hypothetical protein
MSARSIRAAEKNSCKKAYTADSRVEPEPATVGSL